MLSGYGVGSRPVEHVLSGCILGRFREDDAGEDVPGECRGCGTGFNKMRRLRYHIRFDCNAREVSVARNLCL